MKILSFLNGTEGWQTGIEDGFDYLLVKKRIQEYNKFYFDDYAKKFSYLESLNKMSDLVQLYNPDMIIFFHIGEFPITKEFIKQLRDNNSNRVIVYDEGDMYGGFSKPITKSMKLLMKNSDIVSIRGLGDFYKNVFKFNRNIIYTPHHADIARFNNEPYICTDRKFQLSLIGNRITSKIKPRLSGAVEREKFVSYLSNHFGSDFKIFGNGWNKFKYSCGPINFQDQMDVYKNSWITVAYEHYPNIPYYFSNRLPIALLSGSLYVCHYHKGYDNIFKNCDFIFFFHNNQEALDIITYIQSLSKVEILERAQRAREFALKHFTPEVVWSNFFTNIMNTLKVNK